MADSTLINDFILEPLMLRNRANMHKSNCLKTKNKGKKVFVEKHSNNLSYEIEQSLLPQNALVKETDFSNVFNAINMGNCVLFVDTFSLLSDSFN